MNPYWWGALAVAVVMVAFVLGCGVARKTDALTIASLRDALADTQRDLNDQYALTAEAVAAQEAAEEALKAAHERKSNAGRKAWVTRKANAA